MRWHVPPVDVALNIALASIGWVALSAVLAVVVYVLALHVRVRGGRATGLAWFAGWSLLWLPWWLYVLGSLAAMASAARFQGCCYTGPFLTGRPTGTGIWCCSVWEWRMETLWAFLKEALKNATDYAPLLQCSLLLYALMFAWLIGFRHSSAANATGGREG